MPQLLQPAKLDADFMYPVEKDGVRYEAGARDCYLHGGDAVFGRLSLERLGEEEVSHWTPRLLRPFAVSTSKIETREPVVDVPLVLIAHGSWRKRQDRSLDDFIMGAANGILQKHQARMAPEDIRLFFEQVHNHYMAYLL